MDGAKNPFWNAQDEVEYLRQEQQRVEQMKVDAFSTGFEAGAAWAISRGIREVARTFEKTAVRQNEFPPELVKSFAAFMTELTPKIEKTIITGAKKARTKAAATRQGGRL